LHSDWNSSSW